MEEHNFGWALSQLLKGMQVKRSGWNGKNQFIKLQVPDSGSANTEPYIYFVVSPVDEIPRRVPWVASQTDLLASDWEEVDA